MAIERIMLVDESEANRLFFEVVLNELGIKTVTSSTNANQALSLLDTNKIQFVLVCWEMSILPGTIFVQKAREHPRRRSLPHLIYSKRMSESDVALTSELGLANVLPMPLDKQKASAAIKAILDVENNLSKEERLLRKIETTIAEGKPSEALKLFGDKSLRGPGPHFTRAQVALAEIWIEIAQPQKAEEALNLALATEPNHVGALTALATLHSRRGNHEEAISLLTRLSGASPSNLSTLLSLGSAYVEADRPEDAKATFAKISGLDPDSARLKDEQGKLAFKQGDLPLAAQLLAETQAGDALTRYFNNLAVAMAHRNEFDGAISTYENAIKLLNGRGKAYALHYNLGLALARKGDLGRAFQELVASYLGDPSFEKAFAALVRVAKQMDEKKIAYDKSQVKAVNLARHKFQQQNKAGEPGAA